MDDAAGFTTFVRQHSTTLLRAAYLLTGDRGAAEELVQDTLVRLYPQWSRVQAADVPLAYVRRCLTNNFLNSRRRAGREVLFADPPERGYERPGRRAQRPGPGPRPARRAAPQAARGAGAAVLPDLTTPRSPPNWAAVRAPCAASSAAAWALRAETERRTRPHDTSPTNGNLR